MNNQNDNSHSIIKKSFISSIIFMVLVLVVFYFIFKNNNYREVQQSLLYADKKYLLLAVICMSFFSICEALNLKIALTALGDKVSYKDAYKYAISGFFVASITPSSTGGDPMQLYLMKRDNIKISHGAISLLVKLLAYEFVIIVLSLIGFTTSHSLFFNSLGKLKYIAFLGVFLNILVFSLYFLIIFFKPVILFLVELFSKLLHKIHFKKADIVIDGLSKQVEEYSKASLYLKRNKKVFLQIFIITLFQFVLYYSIPYFVYLSLGFSHYSIITFITIQSMLFVCISSLPFPGAVGVSEATFMRIYREMFPKTILGSAMVITRFINFYIFVLYAGITMIYYFVKDNYKDMKE